jgi:hypothetical protein
MPKTVDPTKLLEGLTLTPEQQAAINAALSVPENHETLSRRFLRREEGTRLAQEAQRSKADAEAEMQRAQAFQSELVSWEQQNKPKLTAYETYIKNLGIPEERVLSGANPNPPAPGQPAGTNPQPPGTAAYDPTLIKKDFVSREEMGLAAKEMVEIPFDLHNISVRHRELYGVEAPAEKLIEIRGEYLKTGKPLQALAAEAFHFDTRAQELAAQKLEQETTRLAEEKFQKMISERGIPAAVAAETSSALFSEDFAKSTSSSERAQSTDAAFAHFQQTNAELDQQGKRPTY